MKLDLNNRDAVLEFARKFDIQKANIPCLAGNDIVRFARALGEALGVHDEGNSRAGFDRKPQTPI